MSVIDKITDVLSFDEDRSLLSDRSAVLAIKNFERQSVRKRVLARRAGNGKDVPASSPRDGIIAKVRLDNAILNDADINQGAIEKCTSPYQYVAGTDCYFFNSYDRVFKRTPTGLGSYGDALTRRVHSIDISETSGDVIISSSGFDVIHRFDRNLRLQAVYSVWQAVPFASIRDGRRHSLVGFNCDLDMTFPVYEVDPEKSCFEKGLGVGASPFYISSASFSHSSEVLYTGYNSGSLFVTNFSETSEYPIGLRSPHSFLQLGKSWAGRDYCVLDSGRGHVVFLDSGFGVVDRISLASLPKDWAEYGNEEWIQFASLSGKNSKVLLVADQIRQSIHILDFEEKKRRDISYPNSWSLHGIQLVS